MTTATAPKPILPPDAAMLAPPRRPPGLSRRRKAAMIVQLLLADGQKLSLAQLPEAVQAELTRELGALRLVDKATLHAVAAEFVRDLESVGLAMPGGVESAIAALAGSISPATAARLRAEAEAAHGADPWAQIAALPPRDLVPIMDSEAIEVAAVVLSKLPVSRAAELLGLLPGEQARRITYAVSQTSGVTPEAVARIGRALAAEHCGKPAGAFSHPPVQRVGAILNSSPPATRDAVLAGLGDDDPGFAEQVRRAIFTFPDIPERVPPVDVPKVIRGVEQEVLVTALAAAAANGGNDGLAADFILANMSQRLADQLREEIGERGKIRKTDGETAMAAVITEIRTQADAGNVTLIVPDDDEDDD